MFSHVQIPMGEPEEEVEKHLDDDELAVDSQPQPLEPKGQGKMMN